jgi:hypothetical protein
MSCHDLTLHMQTIESIIFFLADEVTVTPTQISIPAITVEETEKHKKNETKPKILVGPSNTTAFLGDRVELLCQVSGKPKPRVTWHSRRDGKLPSVGQNFRIHANNSLIIRFAEKRDESNFHCTATNTAGAAYSNPARLSVEGICENLKSRQS